MRNVIIIELSGFSCLMENKFVYKVLKYQRKGNIFFFHKKFEGIQLLSLTTKRKEI